MESRNVDLSALKVGAIINTSSGGCDSASEGEMLSLLKSVRASNYETWCGQAHQIETAFAEAATHKLDVLVVLGGDGTIRTAAKACIRTGTSLLPLPGGTMNMLPRALYGEASWQETLEKTLAGAMSKTLSAGRTEEELFFVAAVIGAPALWMEVRESMRKRDIFDVVEKSAGAFQAMFDTKIRYSMSSETQGEAKVIAVICPLVSEQMSDSEQALEAAVINTESATELFGLATAAALGKWRDDRAVMLTKTKRVTIQSTRDIPLFLDGERVKANNNAEITFVPSAVNVIVPAEEITSPS
jgi:diacylglycerol kinase family enzyme